MDYFTRYGLEFNPFIKTVLLCTFTNTAENKFNYIFYSSYHAKKARLPNF